MTMRCPQRATERRMAAETPLLVSDSAPSDRRRRLAGVWRRASSATVASRLSLGLPSAVSRWERPAPAQQVTPGVGGDATVPSAAARRGRRRSGSAVRDQGSQIRGQKSGKVAIGSSQHSSQWSVVIGQRSSASGLWKRPGQIDTYVIIRASLYPRLR